MDWEFNFEIGFNNSLFSNRLLRIEIMGWPLDSSSDSETYRTRRTNCRRKYINKKSGEDKTECFEVIRVREVHVNSIVLAAKSLFFYKSFINGMNEKDITVRINASEEAAFMEVLKFMYCNSVSVDSTPALFDVLMVAAKFEALSCMRYCRGLLGNFLMTNA